VICAAQNATYPIYAVTEEEFSLLFPGPDQNIKFSDDVISRIDEERAGELLTPIWKRRGLPWFFRGTLKVFTSF
jgi:hypothetical protein